MKISRNKVRRMIDYYLFLSILVDIHQTLFDPRGNKINKITEMQIGSG